MSQNYQLVDPGQPRSDAGSGSKRIEGNNLSFWILAIHNIETVEVVPRSTENHDPPERLPVPRSTPNSAVTITKILNDR